MSKLLENLKMTKIKTDPKLKEEYEKKSSMREEINFFESDQYSMKPIRKNSTVKYFLAKIRLFLHSFLKIDFRI